MGWALVGGALVGPHGLLWAVGQALVGPLGSRGLPWALVGTLVGRALVGWALVGRPGRLWAALGPCGPGPCGPPWAFVGPLGSL